jgi:hypothetical protein
MGHLSLVLNRDTIASVIELFSFSSNTTDVVTAEVVVTEDEEDKAIAKKVIALTQVLVPNPTMLDVEATSRVLSPKWLEAIRLGKASWNTSSSSSSSSSQHTGFKSLIDQALERTPSLQLTLALGGITAALNAEILDIPTLPEGDSRYDGLLSSTELEDLVRIGSDYGYGTISQKVNWRNYIYPGPVGYISIQDVFAAVSISSFATEISAQVQDIIIADTGREPTVEGGGENEASDGNRRHATFLSRRCIPLASDIQNSELNCIRDSEQSSTEAMKKKLLLLLERVSLIRSEASLTEDEFLDWCWTGADSFTDTCGCAGPLVGRSLLSPPDMNNRNQQFLLFDGLILNDGTYAGLPCGMQIRATIQQPHITLSLAFLFGFIGYFTSGPIQDALTRLSSDSSASTSSSSSASSSEAETTPVAAPSSSVSSPFCLPFLPYDLHETSFLPLIDAVIYRPVVVLPLYSRSEEGMVAAIDTLQARSSDLNQSDSDSTNATTFDTMSAFHLDRTVPLLGLSRLVINHSTKQQQQQQQQQQQGGVPLHSALSLERGRYPSNSVSVDSMGDLRHAKLPQQQQQQQQPYIVHQDSSDSALSPRLAHSYPTPSLQQPPLPPPYHHHHHHSSAPPSSNHDGKQHLVPTSNNDNDKSMWNPREEEKAAATTIATTATTTTTTTLTTNNNQGGEASVADKDSDRQLSLSGLRIS